MSELKTDSKTITQNESEICNEIFELIQNLFPKMMSIKIDNFIVDKYDVKMQKGNNFRFTISFTSI